MCVGAVGCILSVSRRASMGGERRGGGGEGARFGELVFHVNNMGRRKRECIRVNHQMRKEHCLIYCPIRPDDFSFTVREVEAPVYEFCVCGCESFVAWFVWRVDYGH